ncbi:MAG: AgmX/PglI C-terminal domain-containing protein, partial [Deltaproteobacteria bacterium]|nr:AgmX/PglI C-terminal domain-containing protein [Deltaproteobacteria bacterium]
YGDAAASLFSPDSDTALDAALAGVGHDLASAGDGGFRAEGSGRDGDLVTELDDSDPAGIVVVGDGKDETAPARRQWGLAPEQAPRGDAPEGVGDVIRAARGRVESCVQVASRQSPELAGRVELAWSIENGRPAAVRVTQNRTGDLELGHCIERAVLALDFGEGTSARVDGYAWIVQAVQ